MVQSPGLEFESKTELEVLDGANLLMVGQELVQYAGAEQLGSSEWRLSKLLRGRRGTEWAMSTHQVGETVLVLDPAALTRTSSLDEVGLARFYRAVSIGSDPSLPAAVAFTNEAASLKPYAPVHVQGSRTGGGDLTITWVRRTRYSGEWRDLIDVPLTWDAGTAEGTIAAPHAGSFYFSATGGTDPAVLSLASTSPRPARPASARISAAVTIRREPLPRAAGRAWPGRLDGAARQPLRQRQGRELHEDVEGRGGLPDGLRNLR